MINSGASVTTTVARILGMITVVRPLEREVDRPLIWVGLLKGIMIFGGSQPR
jgi:hypothetical protein